MNNGLPLALGAVALLAVAGEAQRRWAPTPRGRRGSSAVVAPYKASALGDGLYEVIDLRTGERPRTGDGAWMEEERAEVERLAERLNRDELLRRLPRVGPSSDWANEAWALPDGRVLYEDEDGDLLVLRRYEAQRGYPGLPAKHRNAADGITDVLVEEARYATASAALGALGVA